MKRFLLLLFVLAPFGLMAQSDYYNHFNTDTFWHNLVLDAPGTTLSLRKADTAIVVASNRADGADKLRFMSEFRGKNEVRYYLVYTRGMQWHVHSFPSLRAATKALPDLNKDWVVYTEGMGKIFTTDLDRGLALSSQYGVNVLLLDYPSICTKYKAYRNYHFALRNSRIAYHDFVSVLDTFRNLRVEGLAGDGKLSLFFHSMGNNVIMQIARTKLLNRFNDKVWVDNLVLNAPCVPARRSNKWLGNIHFANHVYIHYNPHDGTLKWARIAGFRRILGERPRKPVPPSVTFVNFNGLCGNGHSNFLSLYNRPPAPKAAVAHYKLLLHGMPIKDTVMYRASMYRHIGYDLLPECN